MVHGGPSGCTFTGTDGTLRIDRDHLSSDPVAIVEEPPGAKDIHLEKSPGHHRNWLDCIRSRKRPLADVEIGARSVAITILGNRMTTSVLLIKALGGGWNDSSAKPKEEK